MTALDPDDLSPIDPYTPPPRPARKRRAGSWNAVAWLVGLLLAGVLGTLLFTAGFLVALGSAPGGGTSTCAAPSEAFQPFCEAYERLKSDYVDPLDDDQLVEGALRGLFEYGVGDPYSAYMPPEAFSQARQDLSGRFEGIGAEMAVENLEDPDGECPQLSETCVLIVVAPLADSPAEAAGLRAGDIVRTVDGEEVAGTTMQDQVSRVRGPAGTEVTLGIERDGERFELTITRAEIVIREVETRLLEGGIGYISLKGFSDKSGGEFRDGLEELLAQDVEQIVFDVRNNPGGYITAAQDIVSEFVSEGVIFTQESHGDETREWNAKPGGLATDPSLEVVVLTNEGSASASEIVAVALQELGRATVIGQPTFGKNTVQIWAPLENNGGVRITISRWFGPNHVTVAPDGVQPDVLVEIPEDTPPDRDLILERAVSFLQSTAADDDESSVAPSTDARAALRAPASLPLAAYSLEADTRVAA